MLLVDTESYGESLPSVLYLNSEEYSHVSGRAVFESWWEASNCLNKFRKDFPEALYGIVDARDVCKQTVTLSVADKFISGSVDYYEEGIYEDEKCDDTNCNICW